MNPKRRARKPPARLPRERLPAEAKYSRTTGAEMERHLKEITSRERLIIQLFAKKIRGRTPAQLREFYIENLPEILRRFARYDSSRSSVENYLKNIVNSIALDYLREARGGRVRVKRGEPRITTTLPMDGWKLTDEPVRTHPRFESLNHLLEKRGDMRGESNSRRLPRHGIQDESTPRLAEQLMAKELVEYAVKVLPPQMRQAVYLHYFQGLSEKAAGNQMGLSESRVSKILKSAMERMRLRLKNQID